jgi:predicted enzyme related to lactoylglutathione lyase
MDSVLSAPGNVFYFVHDLAAAVDWYAARLGAQPVTRAAQLAMFELPGARLTLHAADEFNEPGPSGTVPYWTVADVDAVVALWTEQGASAHRGPKTIMTGERLCQMRDPFGNLFGLRQPPP